MVLTQLIFYLIQSIVNRSQWNSGQDILLIVKYKSGGDRKAYSYNGNVASAPQLTINYRPLNYPVSYITTIDEASLPYGGSKTVASYVVSTFNDNFQALCGKELGFSVNTSVAINDINATLSNMPVIGNVIRNDFDVEQDNILFSRFLSPATNNSIVSGAVINGKSLTGDAVNNAGILTFNANGRYEYTPSNDFSGQVIVPYISCDDGAIVVCDTAYLIINVGDFPNPNIQTTNGIIVSSDYNSGYGSALRGNVMSNDDDVEEDNIEINYFYAVDGERAGVESYDEFDTPFSVGGINRYGNYISEAGVLTFTQEGTYNFIPSNNFMEK
ncbi:MAG: Ig-like domain-containing protein [Chitinophagales bacterium]